MATPGREQLYFDAIKENHGSYFVEYQPPVGNNPFATLNLVYAGAFELSEVGKSMRAEMLIWLARYPVPVMISAFDAAENVLQSNGDADDAFLIGWLVPGKNEIASSWKLNELPAFLNDTTSIPDWRTIYKDVPFRTDTEVKANAQKQLEQTRKQNLRLIIILIVWVAFIPAAWETIKYFGPHWLEFIVYVFALWQAFKAARKLLGRAKLTRIEEEKAEKERKMAHYFYHCERNPAGFARIKVENFEKDISERTRKEAEELAKKRSPAS
jgi:hypothetical protein